MMCDCGGRTMPASARENGATLRWECCGACGRCDAYALKVEGVQAASGQAGRRAFRDPALVETIRQRLLRQRIARATNNQH